MASFVHIADARVLRDILRAGIRPSRHDFSRYAPEGWPARHVFCVPVLQEFEATFQWMRELRRWAPRCVAVQFRLPDEERVLVGHFAREHRALTAAEAVAAFRQASPDPRGLQVLLPRKVHPREIVRLRAVPQFVGWRHAPGTRRAPPAYLKPPGIPRWRWERILDGVEADPRRTQGRARVAAGLPRV